MASLVLGSALGYFFGPLGFLAGSALGALLDPQKGPQLGDLHLQGSTYGQVIPINYGTMRVAGQVIWTTVLHPHQSKGKGGAGPQVTTYTASFDVLIAEGPILGVQRIWADGTLIYDTTGTVTGLPSIPVVFYTGTETQLPDPTEEAVMGVGNVPAYRGYARAVFTELELTNYGNSIPRLTFQIFSQGGTIPVRISTFDPWPGGSHSNEGATYSNGIITTSASNGVNPVDSNWSQFTPQGVQQGSTVVSPWPNTGQPGPYGSNIPDLNSWMGLDTLNLAHWYTDDPGTGVAFDAGMIGNGTPPYTAPQQMQKGMYIHNFIYTIGNLGYTVLGMYAAPSGNPGAFTGSTYGVSGTEVIINLGFSDTNQLYVLTSPGGGGAPFKLYRFLPDSLNLDTTWATSVTSATHLQSYTGGYFFVYQNLICFEANIGSVNYIALVKINGAALANTGQLLPHSGHPDLIYLVGSTGLGVDADGVFSLFPPSGPIPLSEIVEDISNRCGLQSTQVDVTRLLELVPGYLITNQSTGRDNIMELRTSYFFDGVESNGIMKFIPRGGPSEISIPLSDLATQSGHHSGTPPPPVLVERTQEVDLPATMYVVFIDPTDQYLNGTQYARRLVTNSENTATVQVAVAMTPATARQKAQLLLFTAWLERNTLTVLLPRKYAALEPTDVILVTDLSNAYQLRITEKTFVASDVVQLKGVIANTNTFIAGPVGVPGGSPSGPPTGQTQSPTNLVLLNLPLIIDTDFPYGPYCAMAGASATLPWGGGILYESSDGGVTYNQITSSGAPNVIGKSSNALGDFHGGNVFDKINKLTVVIGNGGGTLASATEAAVLNGANIAYLGSGSGSGGEVFQFASAVLTAPNTYVLSDLLRGRRGTEWQTGGHAPGELFILLPIIDINGPFSDLGNPRLFKALSSGQALAGVTAQSFLNSGETLRPYSPCQVYSGLNVPSSGDVAITWRRRTRIGGVWAEFTDVPLSEPFEAYVLQIWDSTYTVCARVIGPDVNIMGVITLLTSPYTYTGAMQITDFGSHQQTIFASIGQLGDFGLGVQTFVALPGAGSSNTSPLNPVPPYNTSLPPSTPPTGCTGTPITGPSGNAFTWATEWALPSGPGFDASKYWLVTIPVSSSPNPGLCKVTVTNATLGPLAPGSISAVLSSTPNCGPPMIPAVSVSGQSQVSFSFSIGPSPNPATTPQLLPNTTYYFLIKTTVSQLVQATLYTQG